MSGTPHVTVGTKVHDVWANNVEEEFARMRAVVADYPYVAMDTEFPGIVATPLGQFRSKEDFNFQQISCNVNMLKLIQVGFAMVNEKGELPPNGDIWQFNFHFSLNEDMYSQDSIDLLRSSGFDFNRHQTEGISNEVFGELLTTSGLIVDDRITWITFSAGFDFGYLFRSITLKDLPKEEESFFYLHRMLFPRCYDVKMILRRMPMCMAAKLRGGLQDVATQLDVKRVGSAHQAGSDALLTAHTFLKIKQQLFGDSWDRVSSSMCGQLSGLGCSFGQQSSSRQDVAVPK